MLVQVVFSIHAKDCGRAVFATVVSTGSARRRRFVVRVGYMLGVYSKGEFFCRDLYRSLSYVINRTVVLVVSVVVGARSDEGTILLARLHLGGREDVRVALVRVVRFGAVNDVLVIGHPLRSGNGVNVLLLVGCVDVLNRDFMAVHLGACFVGVVYQLFPVASLPTIAAFEWSLSAYLGSVIVTRVHPAIPRVVLLCPKGVNGTVVVYVVYLYFVFVVYRR